MPRLEMQFLKLISEEVFAWVNGMDLASDIWKELIEIHEGSTKVRE